MLDICVLSHSFPTKKTIDFVFVEQLCKVLRDIDVNITIIAPQSLTKCLFRKVPIVHKKSFIFSYKGNIIQLYRPYWVSFGNKVKQLRKIQMASFNNAINDTLKKINKKFDAIYCHFWAQAIVSCDYAIENNIPLIVVAGEGNLTSHIGMQEQEITKIRKTIKGVICVSSKSKKESIDAGFATSDKCIVIPNSIDPKLFYKMDKNLVRNELKINKDDFVVAFVGQFNTRKGIDRLSNALKKLNNPNIKALFIGTGALQPSYSHAIVSGMVSHDILPKYLNAADVFVLPTNNEGCSNAIVEAMACGLPILSSNKYFNYDILDNTNSILFDPYNIDEIASSIKLLYENRQKRSELSNGALMKAKELTIEVRAKKIKEFIQSCIKINYI